MISSSIRSSSAYVVFLLLVLIFTGCESSSSRQRFYGRTVPPRENVVRYVSGGEPESLDPPVSNSQPDARILISLFDGLVEYHPKTMEPIPGIAESWELSKDATEYVFHLRKNAKWSDGTPITSKDFVYSFRRGFSPELASRNSSLGYFIKYSEAYNSGWVFVKDASGKFLLKKDFVEADTENNVQPHDTIGFESKLHEFLDSPERLTLKGDEKGRAAQLDADARLKSAVEGAEFVPVQAEDIGVEAVDDYTLRLKLTQPAPFALGVLGHQFFRLAPQHIIEKFGKDWTRPENIVTCGAFKVAERKPYDKLVVIKDPNNWDAANVKIDRIEFYPSEEIPTIMNLYKAGEIDAVYNHTVLASWLDEIRPYYKDEYLNFPEVATEFYVINIKKPPMDNLKVRQAFALAVDRTALSIYRKVTKPLVDFTPEGIFPQYEEARKKVQARKLKELNINEAEWNHRIFDPLRARKLLAEAGYPVEGSEGNYSCPKFPVDQVAINYNTAESNRVVAEFIQEQWRKNLGITVTLKNMEFKTFLPMLNKVEYDGFGRRGWVGDYMDPFTFLYLQYTENNESATGWHDKKYDELLSQANRSVDPDRRYELMAEAEFLMMQQQVVIPLQTNATNWMKKPYLKGIYPNPGTLHPWKFVYIERDPSKWDKDVENIMTTKDPSVEKQIEELISTQKLFEESQASKSLAAKAKTAEVN